MSAHLSHAAMSAFVEQAFERVRAVRESGQKEYARASGNVFANFDRLAALLDTSREEVILVYLVKHLDGVVSHVRGHRSQREHVSGRFADLHAYLLLLEASLTASEAPRSDEAASDGSEAARGVLEASRGAQEVQGAKWLPFMYRCAVCGDWHAEFAEDACDELHASYTPTTTADARDIRP